MNEVTEQKDLGNFSDGYHTFNELYEHRCLLWIKLCLIAPHDSYWVRDHYPNWDLLLMETPDGQISYHVKSEYRNLIENRIPEKRLEEHTFDGHTSQDVISRLKVLFNSPTL